MCKIDSATCTYPNTSACNTCQSIACQCCEHNDEEDLFEYHLTGDVKLILLDKENIIGSGLCSAKQITCYDITTVTITPSDTILDKIQGGFLFVCALFALSFNRAIDFVLDGFQKAFRSGRL